MSKSQGQNDINGIGFPAINSTYSILNASRRDPHLLPGTSRINIFVGPNNSGKSRLLRDMSMSNLVNLYKTPTLEDISFIDSNRVQILEMVSGLTWDDETNSLIQSLISTPLLPLSVNFNSSVSLREIQLLCTRLRQKTKRANVDISNQLLIKTNAIDERLSDLTVQNDVVERCYIPVSRSIAPVELGKESLREKIYRDYFKERDKKQTNSGQHNIPKIHTGETFYNELRSLYGGTSEFRDKKTDYENFLSTSIFDGESVTLTPVNDRPIPLVKIGREKEQLITELGDGVQNIIVLTFLPFTTTAGTFFFIEEPETHLHPSFQRKLLELYCKLEQHTFFISTHSNHLLDLTIDTPEISIYTVRKILAPGSPRQNIIPTFEVSAVDRTDFSVLEILGVRNSSVFLANSTIWVEGITDRLYLKKMLSLYQEYLAERDPKYVPFAEDLHYVFVEYGGNNITHWAFANLDQTPIEVQHLCSRAMVIIDKDEEGEKIERKEMLRKNLDDGKRLIELPCREIENTLPGDVLLKTLDHFTKSSDGILFPYTWKDYKDEPLGNFIDTNVPESKRNKSYSAESGTIANKLPFCKTALKHLVKFEQLEEEIQDVVKRIHQFISNQNIR